MLIILLSAYTRVWQTGPACLFAHCLQLTSSTILCLQYCAGQALPGILRAELLHHAYTVAHRGGSAFALVLISVVAHTGTQGGGDACDFLRGLIVGRNLLHRLHCSPLECAVQSAPGLLHG